MIANSCIDPISGPTMPVSPNKFSPSAPPAYFNGVHNPNNFSLSRLYGVPPQALQPQHPSPPQGSLYPHGILNVNLMMEYSIPGSIQAQPIGGGSPPPPPPASLKPMPQPPPFPALNEVSLSGERQRVRCPYCQASIITKVNYSTGMLTHINAVAVMVIFCPLFWIPYCMDSCKDIDHSCPNCGRVVGKFKRFQ